MDNCLFTSFYKKCYKDVSNLTDKEIKKHWKKIGKKEGRLSNKILFEQTFPNFNIKDWGRTNNKYIFTSKYEIYGWIYLKKKKNYEKYLISNDFVLDYKNKEINTNTDNNNLELMEIISKYNLSKDEFSNNKLLAYKLI